MVIISNEKPSECLQLFQRLQNQKIPIDEAISMSIIGACSQIGLLSICQQIVKQIPLHLRDGIRLKTALISMWVSKYCFRVHYH